ncbi:hypothetical protein [Actinomycetospora atypica]|uniref:Uncharacterized protein n=1 Tax=Actinomycetospora atypica TaxID=1290095 RepID=A0ABV9YIH7_9PSEU
MSRRNLDDLLALLWGVGGVVVAGYLLHLALGPGSLEGSRLPLVGLAAVALIGFSIVAVRHARRARETRAEQDSGPVHGWRVGPRTGSAPESGPAPVTGPAPETMTPIEPPELSPSGRAELARIVGIADRAGLFAPRAPRPVDLMETTADHGEPVTLQAVLGGIGEAAYWRPGFRPEDHLGALAFHDSQTEQFADTLTEQVEDLARLVGDALPLRLLEVEATLEGRTHLRLQVGEDERTLDYLGHIKALSTVLHATVARALREAHPEGPRLAWLWADQGVWLAALRTTTVEALNADFGRALEDPWQWVDEQPPTAAGDVIRRHRGRG